MVQMGEIFERTIPHQSLEWTGERLTTATSGQVEIEHLHRYFFARSLCRGLDVLDVASGEGYGSALLAQVARTVVGVELSEEAVRHAEAAYVMPNLRYQQGDARKLPLEDASIDAVVSFETLEHFFEHDRFLSETKRVLRPGGILILSSPESDVYSPLGSSANPYHVHELSRVEFANLLKASFQNVLILLQRPVLGSALIAAEGARVSDFVTFERRGAKHYEVSSGLPRPPYNIAVASDMQLPIISNSLSIETSEIGEIIAKAEAGASVQLEFQRQAEASASVQLEFQRHMLETEKLASGFRNELQRASETIDQLRTNLEQARLTQEIASRQRDALRITLRNRATAFAELLHKNVELTSAAASWEDRYFGLRRRLEIILHRFWIIRIAQIFPRSVRNFVRVRALGGDRTP